MTIKYLKWIGNYKAKTKRNTKVLLHHVSIYFAVFALAANLFHPPLGLWPSQIRYCQSAFFNDLQFCSASNDHFGLVLTSCLSQFRLERSDPTRHLHTQIKRKLSKLICKKMRIKSLCHIFMLNCRVRSFLLLNTFSY